MGEVFSHLFFIFESFLYIHSYNKQRRNNNISTIFKELHILN